MDISSGNTRQIIYNRPNNMFKPSGPPNFTSKELFNVDNENTTFDQYEQDYYDSNEPHEYEYNPQYNNQSEQYEPDIQQDENFPTNASTSKPPDYLN